MATCGATPAQLATATLVDLGGVDQCRATQPYAPDARGCGVLVGCAVGRGQFGALRVTSSVAAGPQGRCSLDCAYDV